MGISRAEFELCFGGTAHRFDVVDEHPLKYMRDSCSLFHYYVTLISPNAERRHGTRGRHLHRPAHLLDQLCVGRRNQRLPSGQRPGQPPSRNRFQRIDIPLSVARRWGAGSSAGADSTPLALHVCLKGNPVAGDAVADEALTAAENNGLHADQRVPDHHSAIVRDVARWDIGIQSRHFRFVRLTRYQTFPSDRRRGITVLLVENVHHHDTTGVAKSSTANVANPQLRSQMILDG